MARHHLISIPIVVFFPLYGNECGWRNKAKPFTGPTLKSEKKSCYS